MLNQPGTAVYGYGMAGEIKPTKKKSEGYTSSFRGAAAVNMDYEQVKMER